ncbi:hypothetical protein C8R45DRAFT_1180132 [Mycena sanguinolenta]|nr:hypothetical protein C8R45DRAFT_1180132 [Mycena sanguinolenta]
MQKVDAMGQSGRVRPDWTRPDPEAVPARELRTARCPSHFVVSARNSPSGNSEAHKYISKFVSVDTQSYIANYCPQAEQRSRAKQGMFTGTVNQNGSGDVIVNGDIGNNATGTIIGFNTVNNNNNNGGGTITNHNGGSTINNSSNSGQIIVDGSQTQCMPMLRQPTFIALLVLVAIFAMLFFGTLVLFIRERRLRRKTMAIVASDGNMQDNLISGAEPIAVPSASGMQQTREELDVHPRRPLEERAQSPWSIRPPTECPPGYTECNLLSHSRAVQWRMELCCYVASMV